jgi:hypothetical protein
MAWLGANRAVGGATAQKDASTVRSRKSTRVALTMYRDLPEGEVAIEEFERFAVDRLRGAVGGVGGLDHMLCWGPRVMQPAAAVVVACLKTHSLLSYYHCHGQHVHAHTLIHRMRHTHHTHILCAALSCTPTPTLTPMLRNCTAIHMRTYPPSLAPRSLTRP